MMIERTTIGHAPARRASPERATRIAVCGGSGRDVDAAVLAEQVGRELARAGAILICGGLGGVMEAAARGVADAGGLTIGVLPGHDAADANPWIEVPLPTGMGEARNVLVVRFAEAVIAIGGEWGTLSEIAFAQRTGVPVVPLASPLAEAVGLRPAADAHAAVRAALDAAAARRAARAHD